MTARTLTVDHDGVTYTGEVARIDRTSLGWEDHGILTAYLHLSWASSGISVGGYCLDQPKGREARAAGDYGRVGTAYGLDHLMRLLETVGVDTWEKLPGQPVVVLFEGRGGAGGIAAGIAGLHNDRVFIPRTHAAEWTS